jgi:ATP-dependent protease ClpP protease subunit
MYSAQQQGDQAIGNIKRKIRSSPSDEPTKRKKMRLSELYNAPAPQLSGGIDNGIVYDYDVDEGPGSYRIPDEYDKSIFIAGEREIHFNAHVDGETITRIKKLISIIVDKDKDNLVKLDKDGKPPVERANDPPVNITYIVHSPGGSVHDVLDFVDYVNLLRCTYHNIRFTSIITGMVASAGTTMCIIADEKQMTRFAYAMIHELSTGMARTNYTKIMTHAEFIQNLHNDLVTVYLENIRPGVIDKDRLEVLLNKETWMTAQQYKDIGFIDDIIAQYARKW